MLLAQHPNELAVHPRRAASSPTRRRGSSARLKTVKGSHAADAVDQRHPRPRPGGAARRADRVLVLHVRPGRRRAAARGQAGRARRRRLGSDQRTRPPRQPPAATPSRRDRERRVDRDRHERTAVVERSPPRARPRRASASAVEAPLLAVCGLCGGAGASTLSYLLARSAVALAAGTCSSATPAARPAVWRPAPRMRACSLAEMADHVARGLPLAGGIYAVDEPRQPPERELRVIATGPRAARLGRPRRRCESCWRWPAATARTH